MECLKHSFVLRSLWHSPKIIARDNRNIFSFFSLLSTTRRCKKNAVKVNGSPTHNLTDSVSRHWLTLCVKASDLTGIIKVKIHSNFAYASKIRWKWRVDSAVRVTWYGVFFYRHGFFKNSDSFLFCKSLWIRWQLNMEKNPYNKFTQRPVRVPNRWEMQVISIYWF